MSQDEIKYQARDVAQGLKTNRQMYSHVLSKAIAAAI